MKAEARLDVLREAGGKYVVLLSIILKKGKRSLELFVSKLFTFLLKIINVDF